MSIKVDPEKIKELEEASLLIDSLREKILNMNDGIINDFDILAKSVSAIVDAHSYKKRLESSNFQYFNQHYNKHRLEYGLASFFCVPGYQLTSPNDYLIDLIQDSSFVGSVIVNGKREVFNRSVSTLELWAYADNVLSSLTDYIVCIDDIKIDPETRNYEIIFSVY
jgi:hypothetical protein